MSLWEVAVVLKHASKSSLGRENTAYTRECRCDAVFPRSNIDTFGLRSRIAVQSTNRTLAVSVTVGGCSRSKTCIQKLARTRKYRVYARISLRRCISALQHRYIWPPVNAVFPRLQHRSKTRCLVKLPATSHMGRQWIRQASEALWPPTVRCKCHWLTCNALSLAA